MSSCLTKVRRSSWHHRHAISLSWPQQDIHNNIHPVVNTFQHIMCRSPSPYPALYLSTCCSDKGDRWTLTTRNPFTYMWKPKHAECCHSHIRLQGHEPATSHRPSKGWQQLVLSDTSTLYSTYRLHGKVIRRSEWFSDFQEARADGAAKARNALLGESSNTNPSTFSSSSNCNFKKRRRRDSATSIMSAIPSKGTTSRTQERDEDLARFAHCSQELAFLGFVKPNGRGGKRRQRADPVADSGEGSSVVCSGSRGAAEVVGDCLEGPQGIMSRLVFAYTMEGEQ
ncbi:unnamed protein product [Choristocarpus tenellus]